MTFNLCKRLYFNTAFLNLFKMGLSGDAHGWGGGGGKRGGAEKLPSLKFDTHILQQQNLAQLYLAQKRSKKYLNQVTHLLR